MPGMRVHAFADSTAISGFKYNPETGQLDVTFKSGRTYTLDGVPADMVEAFGSADSAGRFFAQNLRGKF